MSSLSWCLRDISADCFRSEFTNICSLVDNKKLHVLKRVAVEGNLKSSKFRSIYWAIFLGVLKDKTETWKEQKAEQRFAYESLKQRFSLNPHINREIKDDPLSQDELSVWNQHFCDQELLAVIQQDVVRTFPGVEFFRKHNIQEMMVSFSMLHEICFVDFWILCSWTSFSPTLENILRWFIVRECTRY